MATLDGVEQQLAGVHREDLVGSVLELVSEALLEAFEVAALLALPADRSLRLANHLAPEQQLLMFLDLHQTRTCVALEYFGRHLKRIPLARLG